MSAKPENLLEQLCLIRHTELALLDLFSQGKLNGTVHTCLGQEGCAVGVLTCINKDIDVVFSNHRGHGHYIAYCQDIKGLIAEVTGLPSGVCNGVGGSQHLQFKNFYTNGIQGAGVPIIVGMALAEKHKQSGAIAISFIGDGTFGEGAIYEAFNIAALWQLPVLFVVEHNQFAQSTPTELQHAGALNTRVDTFGIPVTSVDGNDVIAVCQATTEILASIRANLKPQMLFLQTYRLGPHSKGDDFRDSKTIDAHKKRDPILLLSKVVGHELSQSIEAKAKSQVDQIVKELSCG